MSAAGDDADDNEESVESFLWRGDVEPNGSIQLLTSCPNFSARSHIHSAGRGDQSVRRHQIHSPSGSVFRSTSRRAATRLGHLPKRPDSRFWPVLSSERARPTDWRVGSDSGSLACYSHLGRRSASCHGVLHRVDNATRRRFSAHARANPNQWPLPAFLPSTLRACLPVESLAVCRSRTRTVESPSPRTNCKNQEGERESSQASSQTASLDSAPGKGDEFRHA